MGYETLAEVEALAAKATRYEYVHASRTVTAARSGTLILRCMGAGGGGRAPRSGVTAYGGGNGGTVAIKTVSVTAGDQFVITIPAGGAGGVINGAAPTEGGTLTVTRGGTTLLSIPGGRVGSTVANQPPQANAAPTGADWFVLGGRGGTPPASSFTGGGGAMIVEGGAVAGRGGNGNDTGGGGALGNGGDSDSSGGGGAIMNAVGATGGSGFLPQEMSVLRLSTPFAVQPYYNGSIVLPGSNGPFGGGGGHASSGGAGGFGGGGGGGGNGGAGGFGGGGGGGFGGGGAGGQGWVTLEWTGGAA